MMPADGFALLLAAEHVPAKLASVIDAWFAKIRNLKMILSGRKGMNDVICSKSLNGEGQSGIRGCGQESGGVDYDGLRF
jgi:hypothetical protein